MFTRKSIVIIIHERVMFFLSFFFTLNNLKQKMNAGERD